MRSTVVVVIALLVAAPGGVSAHSVDEGTRVRAWSQGAFTSSEAERFLREAKPIERASLPLGVTRSHVLTLRDGSREARAIWKTLDEYKPIQRFQNGIPDIGFRDSWRSEVAAYELDKLLGLHMVPPTVERRMKGDLGSLQLWLEGTTTEAERRTNRRGPPDTEAFNRQMLATRIFHQLIQDPDYKNESNLLVDGRFRLFIVDSSRAFRTKSALTKTEYMMRCPRALIARLRDLNLEVLEKRVGRWLSETQVETLLQRRDRILERISELVARDGQAAVLYP